MSGLLVILMCLAVGAAIVIPNVARAAGPTSNPVPMMRKAGGEQEEFLKLDGMIWIKGTPAFAGIYDKRKDKWLPGTSCANLVVSAHKGKSMSGPLIGQPAKTSLNADGMCVFSLKVPTDQDVTIGVQPFSWGASKITPEEYLKIKLQDKWSYKELPNGGYVKNALNGDGFPSTLSTNELKLDYKEHKDTGLSLPLYIKLMPGQ